MRSPYKCSTAIGKTRSNMSKCIFFFKLISISVVKKKYNIRPNRRQTETESLYIIHRIQINLIGLTQNFN